MKEARNGKSTLMLGLFWKKSSKDESGLLLERMGLCNSLVLLIFLIFFFWCNLYHLCCRLHLGLFALIPLPRHLFIDSHAIFRRKDLTSFPCLPFCSALHKSQWSILLLSDPLVLPYYCSHWWESLIDFLLPLQQRDCHLHGCHMLKPQGQIPAH